jgi:predicted CopG family antitoxin
MATKTISIDVEAYERLSAVRTENESFSQVIKRVVPRPFDPEDWFRAIDESPMSKRAGDAVAERVETRGKPTTRRR